VACNAVDASRQSRRRGAACDHPEPRRGDVYLVEKSMVLPLREWQRWLADNEKRIWRVR